ncbi:MAG TPA: site-specific integrase, partial [Pseudonocardiaceae bacterium]
MSYPGHTDGDSDARRRTGSVRQRGNSLHVRLFSDIDPVTGKDVYLAATIKGKAAHKKADDKLAEFRTQVIQQRSATSAPPLAYAIDEWMRASEIEDSTRAGYVNYIERYIKPALGKQPANKVDARMLETFYNELRRCRIKCNGKPYIEKHAKDDEHDCVAEECKAHECR